MRVSGAARWLLRVCAATATAVGARMLGPSTAIMAGDQSLGRLLRGTNSGSNKSSGCSPSSSQRPSRTPPDSSDGGRERAGAGAAAAQVLTESDLAARHDVLLQDSGTIIMLEQPGVCVLTCTIWC